MKNLIIITAILTLLLMSCATITVRTDYDRETNFSSYKTFRIAEQSHKSKKIPKKSMGMMDKRLKNAIKNELQAMGFILKESGKPDFIVAHHVVIKNKVDVDRYGYRTGRWQKRMVTKVHHYKQGTLILDFVDTDSKELFWRGVATGVLENRNAAEKQIKESVAKIMEKYPRNT